MLETLCESFLTTSVLILPMSMSQFMSMVESTAIVIILILLLLYVRNLRRFSISPMVGIEISFNIWHKKVFQLKALKTTFNNNNWNVFYL